MATSGIEKNVKLWTPSDDPSSINNLKRESEWQEIIKTNKQRVRKKAQTVFLFSIHILKQKTQATYFFLILSVRV